MSQRKLGVTATYGDGHLAMHRELANHEPILGDGRMTIQHEFYLDHGRDAPSIGLVSLQHDVRMSTTAS